MSQPLPNETANFARISGWSLSPYVSLFCPHAVAEAWSKVSLMIQAVSALCTRVR